MIRLDIENRTRLLPRQSTFAGSAWTAFVVGVPAEIDGYSVTGVEVRVVNADGVPFSAVLRQRGRAWSATFAAECFGRFGTSRLGVRVRVTGVDCDGVSQTWTFGVADFEVVADSPSSQPADPGEALVVKGSDVYVKSSVVGGVQHYVKQNMVYDEEMAAWGAEWVGDYVLEGGEFREVSHA